MMSKHPLDLQPGRKLTKEEIEEALRLSTIAELDAVNLYLQLARAIDDEKVRKVFEDIAKEEKTHVGEFLALLKLLDKEQVEELARGAEEVKKLTGTAVSDPQSGNSGSETTLEDIFKQVASIFKDTVEKSRILKKYLPIVRLNRGVESVVIERLVDGKLERTVERLYEISMKFRVSQRSIDVAVRDGQPIEIADAYNAARSFAMSEDKYIVEKILTAEDTLKLPLRSWGELGASVRDVANAVIKLYENGVSKPLILLVSPTRYSDLLVVHEKTGITELERVKGLVDEVIIVPALPDSYAIILSPQVSVLDIVLAGDAEVDYIGPEDGFHEFRVWESIGVRLKYGRGVCILKSV